MKSFPEIAARTAGILAGGTGALLLLSWLGPATMPPPMPPQPIAPKPTASAHTQAQASLRAPTAATAEAANVQASFEVLEKVSASGVQVNQAQREALEKFAFPPMRFRWDGLPQALAPAFLWENQAGVFQLGAQPVPEGPEGDALLANYSAKFAIRFKGAPGQLRLSFNVIQRLKAWVEEAGSELGKSAPVEIKIEAPAPDKVLLKVPATAKTSARTFIVGV